jgi:nucleotide-binding universal stress UspA family protein
MTEPSKRNILVTLDGSHISEQAIALAQKLAEPDGKITLLTVVRAVQGYPEIHPTADAPDFFLTPETQAETAREYLNIVRARWTEGGVQLGVEVETGDPAEEILLAAASIGADLIVMTSHGRGAGGRLRFGSVSDRVARSSTCPVAIVRPELAAVEGAGSKPKRLLVPLDGSELAAQSLPFAIDLAKQLAVPVELVRVMDPVVSRYAAAGTVAMPAEWYIEVEKQMKTEALASLESAATTVRDAGVETELVVLTGLTAPALLEEIKPDDLVVITSHGRGGIRRWLMGSVAEKLVRLAEAPVILVPNARS